MNAGFVVFYRRKCQSHLQKATWQSLLAAKHNGTTAKSDKQAKDEIKNPPEHK